MKVKIEIKNRITGKILFELEIKNNTVKNTLERAVNSGADLTGADLRGADLRGADLRGAYLIGADLTGADLTGAYLTGADLRSADLRSADLRSADLRGAYLTGAYLTGAYLRGADNNRIEIKITQVFTGLYKYVCMPIISVEKKEYVRLGCYTRLLSEWKKDFWNNNNEFPNNGSLDSELRKLAFKTCEKWLKLNRN